MLCGLTGAGKSAALAQLGADGAQTIDLESLAAHRGSAFGALGQQPGQPSHQRFQQEVRAALAAADPARELWVEYKGEYLGSVGVPAELLAAMRTAPRLEVVRSRPERVRAIVAEYGSASAGQWLAAVDRIAPRLGAERAKAVRRWLCAGELAAAVDGLLDYYDRGRRYRAGLVGPLIGRLTASAGSIHVRS